MAGVSVASIYITAAFLPGAFPVVFLIVTACWAIAAPVSALLVLLPPLLPLSSVVMAGMTGTTPPFIFTVAIAAGMSWRPGRALASVRAIPPYALYAALALFVIEFVSVGLSPAPTAWRFLGIRGTRTVVLLVAAAAAGQAEGLRLSGVGWMLYGFLNVLASGYIALNHGSVVAIRTGEDADMTSIEGLVAIVAGMGYCAVGAAWYWFAASSRARRSVRVLYLAAGTLCLASAFYSGRRQAMLATFLAVVLAILSARSAKARLGAAAAAVLVFLLYSYGPLGELIVARGTPLAEFGGKQSSGYLPVHEAGLKAFLRSPLVGIGLGNYSSATQAEGVASGRGWAAAHSSIIRILAETGVIGGAALCVLLLGFLRALIRGVMRRPVADRAVSLQTAMPAFGVVLTGLSVQFLESQEYNFLLGQAIGLLWWDEQTRGDGVRRPSASAAWSAERTRIGESRGGRTWRLTRDSPSAGRRR